MGGGPIRDLTTRFGTAASHLASHWPGTLLPTSRGGSQLPDGGCSWPSEPPDTWLCPGMWRALNPTPSSPARQDTLRLEAQDLDQVGRCSIFPQATARPLAFLRPQTL